MLVIESIESAEEYLDILLNHFNTHNYDEGNRDDYYRASLLFSLVRRMIKNPTDNDKEGKYLIRNTETNHYELFALSPSSPSSMLLFTIIGYGNIESTLLLADHLAKQFPQNTSPGVTGRTELVTAFCERYFQTTHLSEASCTRQSFHVLKDYEPPHRTVPGRMIQADESHQELLIEWIIQFHIDAKLPVANVNRELAEKLIIPRLREKTVYLWVVPSSENDIQERPVSMACASVAPDMVRFGFVYTPEEDRDHGYASILVNLLTKQFLDEGKVCSLNTDADNPVSNSIYYKIGYRVISDERLISFTKP
mmetsp:Transcript_3205/g.3479  ORF Transcript_3205/g.3479 Transcript_3205/m.3479 type:complete len:309 (-) Transcript_3205:153-1079(-)